MTTSDRAGHEAKMAEKSIHIAAERAHAILLVALGTKNCPGIEGVIESVRLCLEAARRNPETEFFAGGGFWVRVDRRSARGSLFPDTFEIMVPATDHMFFWSERSDDDTTD